MYKTATKLIDCTRSLFPLQGKTSAHAFEPALSVDLHTNADPPLSYLINCMDETAKYLIIEPYYGGSHKAFIDGLTHFVQGDFTVLSLPARKWKVRMQLSAPYMAEKITDAVRRGARFDAMVTSTFIDAPVLLTLLARQGICIPLGIYFHENQFAYPVRPDEMNRYQFAAMNCNSALCADAVAFNSIYNMRTCLNGIRRYAQKAADFPMPDIADTIQNKSVVLSPGMDFSMLDCQSFPEKNDDVPVIVWNHRWEHDKNPEAFFQALFALQKKGLFFHLIVLGESFRHQPAIMQLAREKLSRNILHFGYCQDKKDYRTWLRRGTIVVSTALHEFFGMSVLEAVRAGCRPLIPDRLAYPELFPEQYRYAEGDLAEQLAELINRKERITPIEAKKMTEPYCWQTQKASYEGWLQQLRNR